MRIERDDPNLTGSEGDSAGTAANPVEDPAVGYLVTELAQMPERAILDKVKLAAVLKCDPRSINNLVARGELPPPVTLCKRAVWMAGAILTHLEKRMDKELSRAQRFDDRV